MRIYNKLINKKNKTMKNKIDWERWIKNKKGENPLPSIFNWFIERYNYKHYLELGLRKGETYNQIECEFKESIDSDLQYNATHKITTDVFFDTVKEDKMWDIIFIDANHEKEFVKRDIINSLKHLNHNGTIFVHDVNPLTEKHLDKKYCNDAWETFVQFRQTRNDLAMYSFPFGMVGLIRIGKQRLWKKKVEWTWKYFEENRKMLVRELTEEDFIDIFREKNIIEEWKKYHGKTGIDVNDKFAGAFREFDTEILYALIRMIKPSKIIEMSPDSGYTTSVILKACEDNDIPCEIYSFDIHTKSIHFDRKGKINRKLIKGEVQATLTNEHIKNCDFMFIDSNHSYDFGKWYSVNVLPKLKLDTFIWIHDWPIYEGNGWSGKEILDTNYKSHNQWTEPMAVKEFLNKNFYVPVLNTTEVLYKMKYNDEPTLPMNKKCFDIISKGALSQIFKKTRRNIMNTKLISFLMPTRKRTKHLCTLLDSLIVTAKDINQVEVLLRMDNDDEESKLFWKVTENKQFNKKYKGVLSIKIIVGDRGDGYVNFCMFDNELARISSGKWVCYLNDDAVCTTENYDTIISGYNDYNKILRPVNHPAEDWTGYPILSRKMLKHINFTLPGGPDGYLTPVMDELGIGQPIDVHFTYTPNPGDETARDRIICHKKWLNIDDVRTWDKHPPVGAHKQIDAKNKLVAQIKEFIEIK